MLWNYRRSLLRVSSNRFIKTLSFSSLKEGTQEFSRKSSDFDFLGKNKLILTSHNVYSTLTNCPSDLITLSFFLWCAKQRDFFHDALAFGYMFGVVRRLTEKYKSVEGIILELGRVGCVLKAQTFLLLLRIYWHGGANEMVIEVFDRMRHHGFMPNTFACNVVMDVLFKNGCSHLALKLLKETQVPNFLTFNIALVHLCKLNDVDHARSVLRDILWMGYCPNAHTFEVLLNCFCRTNRLLEAHQVVGLMITLGIKISAKVWSIVIHVFCKLRKLDVAKKLSKAGAKNGYSPTVVTYTTLFKAYIETQRLIDAFDILDTMVSEEHAPDLVFYNVLIDCLTKIGHYREALDVFRSLRKQKITPDSYTFSSLLSTICISREFSLLPKLMRGHMMDGDLVFFNSLLSYYCKAGHPHLAIKLCDDMICRGFIPDKYWFAALLSGLCGSREIDKAVDVYHWVVKMYTCIDAHIHTIIMNGLIQVGKYDEAIRIFKQGVTEKDVVSYTVAIRGLVKGGRAGDVWALYGQMKEDGLTPNPHICNTMLSAYCNENNIEMVKWMLREFIDARIELSYYNLLRVSRSDNYISAYGLLVEMIYLGLIAAREVYKLGYDGHFRGVKDGNEHYNLLKGCKEYDIFLDLSSSEDILDAVASVG